MNATSRISLLDFADFHGTTVSKAIDIAASRGMTIGKYADPTSREKEGLTAEEAKDVAYWDVSLIWLLPSTEQVQASAQRLALAIKAARRATA